MPEQVGKQWRTRAIMFAVLFGFTVALDVVMFLQIKRDQNLLADYRAFAREVETLLNGAALSLEQCRPDRLRLRVGL